MTSSTSTPMHWHDACRFPFVVHSTKSSGDFISIVSTRRLLSGGRAPCAYRFNAATDMLFEREKYVMFSVGFGLFVDSATSIAAFVFDADLLLRRGSIIERTPLSFHTCRYILSQVKALERDRWVQFFETSSEELTRFNSQHLTIAFREYVLRYLKSSRDNFEIGDSWGPSAFAKGVIEVILAQSRFRREIMYGVDKLRRESVVVTPSARRTYLHNIGRCRSAYRDALDNSKAVELRCHTRIGILDAVALNSTSFRCIVLKPNRSEECVEWLAHHRDILRRYRIPVFVDHDRIY
jgi:hypothetical protein